MLNSGRQIKYGPLASDYYHEKPAAENTVRICSDPEWTGLIIPVHPV